MAVDQLKKIDIIGVDKETGEVILTITDHLEWDEQNEHLLVFQEKLNSYLAFIESGELLESYPDARGRKPVISVVALYHPNEVANTFLERVRGVVEGAGFGFRFRQTHFNSPP